MAIIARASSGSGEVFEPAPPGMQRAICCDVVDLGLVTGKFGEKHLVRLIWQTEARMPDGKPYLIDRRYTLSLDERSALRRDLETWRTKPFTLTEAAGFDLERLIGVMCNLLIVHKLSKEGDRVFANVSAVLPKTPGVQLALRDYVRVIARTKAPGAIPTPTPIGPSYAPPPTNYVAPDPFGTREPGSDDVPVTITVDHIPF